MPSYSFNLTQSVINCDQSSKGTPMKLFALVALTMCAFAANSVLNRIGVALQGMEPLDFATVRTAAGAAMLWLLISLRKVPHPPVFTAKRAAGAAALAIYMVGFSWAYITLDAGLGALILFGVLQIVVFGWTVIEGRKIPLLRWIGAAIALTGLCVLLWPSGAASVNLGGAISMATAGMSWAAYTLLGRAEADPLGATASNFLLCLPLVAIAMVWVGSGTMPLNGIMTGHYRGRDHLRSWLCNVVSSVAVVADDHCRNCAAERSRHCRHSRRHFPERAADAATCDCGRTGPWWYRNIVNGATLGFLALGLLLYCRNATSVLVLKRRHLGTLT
jgi:drug/metabolite transporter (DMT)-like permease